MGLAKQDEIIKMHFTIFDSDGITPLTGQAGSTTDRLLVNGATAPEAVTVAEISTSGAYVASFTPLSTGVYDLEVTNSDDRVVGENYEVQANDLDDLGLNISRILGLSYENSVYEYSWVADNNNLADIYLYDSKFNAGVHDKASGLIGHYAMTGTFTDNKPTAVKFYKEA